MTDRRQLHGRLGEDAAARYLQARGFVIRERNWRPGNMLRGEVDCIVWQGRILCFVEVKTRLLPDAGASARANARTVAPQEAVTPAKQRQLSRLANAYVSYHRLEDVPCRFDVVEVWLRAAEPQREPRIVLHRNAFDYCGGF
jgi:putative endonuclease